VLPNAADDVTLSDGIYLVDKNVDVRSITVESSATLVFKDIDLFVRTRYILVRGALYLGSETCKLQSVINIILYGQCFFFNSYTCMKTHLTASSKYRFHR
jgi:hypothetical protein